MRKIILAFSFLALMLAASRADAHQVRFSGMHPIPAEQGGGFCQIDFPHVHVYEPAQSGVLYRNHDDGYAFVGDPVPYGYEGPKHAYYGPHPIADGDGVVEYCYLEGPHYHAFSPPPVVQAQFNLKGGVYFYGGHFPQGYYDARPRYTRVNTVYRPLAYQRPVVVVEPPAASIQAGVVIEAPPPPVVSVGVSAGFGFHAGGGVIVGAPPPREVIVERPGRVVVVHDRPTIIEVKEKHHHDNGKHEGRRW